jgi:hypothetical protein
MCGHLLLITAAQKIPIFRSTVEEVPPGLHRMYGHILDKIKRHQGDSEVCRCILSVVTGAHRLLHLAEVGGLSGLPEQITKSTESV